jgi:hypothetical protein
VTFIHNSGGREKVLTKVLSRISLFILMEILIRTTDGDISKDDSCHKLGLRHPVYQIMEASGRLKPGQAVRVGADDFD